MRILAITLALGTAVAPASAHAAACAPKSLLEEALGNQFGEAAFAMGIAVGNVVKFFSNPESGSWTILVVRPDGIAGVVAQGEDLEVEPLRMARPSRLASLSH
jgi:hypothetical protein